MDTPASDRKRRQCRGQCSLKLPTGIDNATGSALYKGQIVKATADPSMQPGDGTWAFSLGTKAYKRLWRTSETYLQADYLFSPADTRRRASFRSQPGQGVLSATDQYLWRAGLSQERPKVRGLAFSAGLRGEGVPVRDLLGSSDGSRRPGMIVSFDPGVMYNFRRETLSVNGPWAIYRNRPPSVPEIEYNITNGDAFSRQLHHHRQPFASLLARPPSCSSFHREQAGRIQAVSHVRRSFWGA